MVFSNCNTTINPVTAIGVNDAKILMNLGAVEMTTYNPVCCMLMNQSCNSSCEAFTLGPPKINLNGYSLHHAPLVVIADKLRSRCNSSVGPRAPYRCCPPKIVRTLVRGTAIFWIRQVSPRTPALLRRMPLHQRLPYSSSPPSRHPYPKHPSAQQRGSDSEDQRMFGCWSPQADRKALRALVR